jgi:hypothetical protein
LCCGVYTPRRDGPRGSRLSSWCTALRWSCPRTSTTTAHEYEHTPNKGIKSRSRTRSTNSRRRAMWHCCGVPSTSRRCGATTSSTCAHTSSTSGTSCSDEFKATRTGTSCRRLGWGGSSSTKYSDQGRTRSSTRMVGSSPTHGTSSTYARFMLK